MRCRREIHARRHRCASGSRHGESLWELSAPRRLEFWSGQNQLLTPLFVLDQFEEVFTLGAENPGAIARLRIDLADLIENRLPATLADRAEGNEPPATASRSTASDTGSLLSFREDFLAAVEGWKRDLPSILRNRLRLLPMSGEQAFEAVHSTAAALGTSRSPGASSGSWPPPRKMAATRRCNSGRHE